MEKKIIPGSSMIGMQYRPDKPRAVAQRSLQTVKITNIGPWRSYLPATEPKITRSERCLGILQ